MILLEMVFLFRFFFRLALRGARTHANTKMVNRFVKIVLNLYHKNKSKEDATNTTVTICGWFFITYYEYIQRYRYTLHLAHLINEPPYRTNESNSRKFSSATHLSGEGERRATKKT